MIFYFMDLILNKLDKLIIFFIIYTITFLVFFKTLPYTLPFVLAFIFAMILKSPTKYLVRKFNFKNSTASLMVTIIFFSIIIILLTFGINSLVRELIELGKNTQSYLYSNEDSITNFVNKLYGYYVGLDPSITSSIKRTLTNSFSKISKLAVVLTGKAASSIVSLVSSVPYILMVVLFTLLCTYFFTKDLSNHKNTIDSIISKEKFNKYFILYEEAKKMLISYIKSYMFLIGITFIETLFVFLIFKIKYSIILSIIAAIADILPLIGISIIYIPLALIYIFIYKNYLVGIGLLIAFAAISIIRQILEPKLLSSSLGLHPVSVLAAIFIGLKANGFSGMFFCIFFVVFYNVFSKSDAI